MSALQSHHARLRTGDSDHSDSFDSERSIKSNELPIRRESKLTFGGLIYIGVTVFLAIGAVNSQNNLLFWLFGVAIATIIVSGLFSGSALMKTQLRARVLNEVHAGQPQRLHYSVRNKSSIFPVFACLISEESKKIQLDGKRVPASVVHVAPRSSVSTYGSFTPRVRGRYIFRQIRLSTRFPFGLMQKSLIFEQSRPLLVLPPAINLKRDLLNATPAHGEQVLRKARRGGESNELWGLREYRAGDPRRRISWKHSARRGDLVVVEQAESYAMRFWIMIVEPDTLDEVGRVHTERAIAVAAALFEQAGTQSTPIGLWYPQRSVRFDPLTGRAQAGRAIRALALLDLDEDAVSLTPAPVRTRDRVILIQRGTTLPDRVSASRIIDTDYPDSWLHRSGSLPDGLRDPS